MKKIIVAVTIFFAPILVQAQENFNFGRGNFMSSEAFRICASIFVLYLFITFVLAIMRTILEHRLRSKLVDKGVSEKTVEQFLQPTRKDSKTQAIKIFLVLAGIGAGLLIVNYTLPLGFHSIAIVAFSIALSYLGYFYYLKQSGS